MNEAGRSLASASPGPARASAPTAPSETAIAPVDLLLGLAELGRLLVRSVDAGEWLDACLLASGMSQIAEDHIEGRARLASAAAGYLAARPRWEAVAASLRLIARSAVMANSLNPAARRLQAWHADVAALTLELADITVTGRTATRRGGHEIADLAGRVSDGVAALGPAILRDRQRLPSCFQSFDQHPDDLAELVDRFATTWPDRGRPVTVVGVRTSGSYLAPMLAAQLRYQGYTCVDAITTRPSQPMRAASRRSVERLARTGGVALVADDPPVTGRSLADVASCLERLGLPASSIVLAIALFGSSDHAPAAVSRWPQVLLPWEAWSVHRRLAPSEVARVLARVWAPDGNFEDVVAARAAAPECAWPGGRGHVFSVLDVTVTAGTGARHDQRVVAEGVGIGYFGAHATTVARVLEGLVVQPCCVVDGVQIRPWLPASDAATRLPPGARLDLADALARHLAERQKVLALPDDTTGAMAGQGTVSEIASTIVSQPFGAGWPVARLVAMDRWVRRTLAADNPSVVDGRAGLGRWFVSGDSMLKVTPAERSYANPPCVDAVWDLAALSASVADEAFEAALIDRWRAITGQVVAPERWLLHVLVHWRDREQRGEVRPDEARRRSADAVRRYVAGRLLADIDRPNSGGVCALDLDGVLEGDALGFPSATPTGTMALRTLLAHGFQPVLVTGRSGAEARDACRAYGLVGAVAEYGAVRYDPATDELVDLAGAQAIADLLAIRIELDARDGVRVDDGCRVVVRAHVSRGGRRRALDAEVVAAVLESSGVAGRIEALGGESQTDFVPRTVDKARGLLLLLAASLSPEGSSTTPTATIVLAVGDSAADAPMLRLAETSFAPAHADASARASAARVTRRPYQLGLADAVAEVVGHRPGRCARCATPALDPQARVLLAVLGVQEGGRFRLAARAITVAARVWRR